MGHWGSRVHGTRHQDHEERRQIQIQDVKYREDGQQSDFVNHLTRGGPGHDQFLLYLVVDDTGNPAKTTSGSLQNPR